MNWIARGVVLSIWLFSFGWLFSVVRFFLTARKLSAGQGPGMFGIEVLVPVAHIGFWLWLMVCVGIGFLVARSWPGKPILWIGLAVTEIIPVGLLTMLLVLLSRDTT